MFGNIYMVINMVLGQFVSRAFVRVSRVVVTLDTSEFGTSI
jgi:hypothetical protein